MLKRVAVLTVVVTACSSGGTPATTPPSVATPATTTTTTSSSTTTTTEATTTTVDRLAEIEAIFQDLEERRLQALYDGDREAFKALFANDEYMTRSMGVFDVVEFEGEPQVALVGIAVLYEGSECLAASYGVRRIDVGESTTPTIVVLERIRDGWGFSYAGEGWVCDGPHPFSS
jgi:hypothetical protein